MKSCFLCAGLSGSQSPAGLILESETTDKAAPMDNRTRIYRCPECGNRWKQEQFESGLGRFSESWSPVGTEEAPGL